MVIVSASVLVSSQLTKYAFDQDSTEKIEKIMRNTGNMKDKLIPLLQNNSIDEAVHLMTEHPKISRQIFIYDDYDNEILSRYYSNDITQVYSSLHPVPPELLPRNFNPSTFVTAFNGESYLIEIRPLMHYRPFLSPYLFGSVLRLLSLLLISAIACYFFARSFTKKIKRLQAKIKRLTPSVRANKTTDQKTLYYDDLDKLSADFDLMAQTLDQSTQLRRRMLSDISHEIRSPLARMQVALEIMRLHYPKAEKHIERIEKETNNINTLMGQIINIHKLQINQPEQKESFDLCKLIESIVSDVDYEYQKNNKQVCFKNKQRIMLLADPEKIKIALENIIRNAISHTKDGTSIEIDLRVNKQTVSIYVTDYGDGVAENQLESIFEPFVRLDSSRNRSTGGYGLGLSIAKQIVQQHEGRINAVNHQNPSGLVMQVSFFNQPYQNEVDPPKNSDKINKSL